MLTHCDRRSATGMRDYAILLLLARLGLLAGEVISLTLDDIDWRAGQLTLHCKGRRSAQVPLIASTRKSRPMPDIAYECEIGHNPPVKPVSLDGWQQRGFKGVSGNSAGFPGL